MDCTEGEQAAVNPILIVDDEPHIVRALSYLLTKQGFCVVTASNGEEGLARAREVFPPLVLLDVMMPGMSGYDVSRTIRQDPALARTYIIMLSARGQESDVAEGLRAGADEYLAKPFSPQEVARRMRELLAIAGS